MCVWVCMIVSVKSDLFKECEFNTLAPIIQVIKF